MSSTPHKKNVVENSSIQADGNVHIGDKVTYIINEQKVDIPHLLTNNIPSNANYILGRETELIKIIEHLQQNKPTILVNGIGGIGKTSVASKYVATYGHQYKHLAWLTVQSSVAEAFTNDVVLLKSLHIEQDVRQLIETQRLTDAFKLVMHKLNALDKTLVVLDNANNPDDLITHKNLFDTAKCHYLITSRTHLQEWTIVEIDHLPPDEAVNLFKNLSPTLVRQHAENSPLWGAGGAVESLLEKLFYHTLLIELVAKAVENAGFSFAELQTMIETKFIHDAQLNEDIVSKGKHGDNYNNEAKRTKIEEYIWLIFSNVKDLGDDAKQILRGMALLPIGVAFDIEGLKVLLNSFEIKKLVPTLTILTECGWVNKAQTHGQRPKYKIHPLIVDVITQQLIVNINFAKPYIKHIKDLGVSLNVVSEYNVKHNNVFLQIAERLSELFFHENDEDISELLHSINWLLQGLGEYHKALRYAERSLQIAKVCYEKDDGNIGARQNGLGWLYYNLGRYDESMNLLESSLENVLNNFGKESQYFSDIQNNLGWVYHVLGRHDKAIKLLEDSLERDIKVLGKNHSKVADGQSNLGAVYRKIGQYQKAAKLIESALKSDLKTYHSNHPIVSVRKSNLALVYYGLKKYETAAKLSEEALEIDIMNFGNEYPRVFYEQSHLALTYFSLENFEYALELSHKALTSALKIYSYDNPKIAEILLNAALIYRYAGEKQQAKIICEMAYENNAKNRGVKDKLTLLLKGWKESI